MAASAVLLSLMMFSTVLQDFKPCFETESNSKPQVQCASGMYPPPLGRNVSKHTVNLDLPPDQRWAELATIYRTEMNDLLSLIKNITRPIFHGILVELVDKYMPRLVDTLPYPFADEMKGIANASGIALGEVALYNLFYEVFTFCTSIVAQSESGDIFHGRSLDFGLFLGWDWQNHTWIGTRILRTLTAELTFQRKGQTVFKSTSFVGYIGVLTALKPNAFSLSVDERFQFLGGYVGVVEWLLGRRNGSWMGFLTRQVAENATGYVEAQKLLAKTELLAPVYFILGGNKSGQACVVTRSFKWFDIWEIGTKNSSWFLVETNYDHWKIPPCFDDRRGPAIQCMNQMGQKNLTFAGLFNVLSTRPVLNKLTTYTTLMEVNSGAFETYLQFCVDDQCPLF